MAYVAGSTTASLAAQMIGVAVGWQMYALTGSALSLGFVGLVQFLPTALLVFVAGHAADRYDRRRVVFVCQAAQAVVAGLFAWGTHGGWLGPAHLYAGIGLVGLASAFEDPAMAALLPAVAPEGAFQRASATSTSLRQVAGIAGPALGGVLFAVRPDLTYAVVGGFWLFAGVANAMIRIVPFTRSDEVPTVREVLAGAHFVRENPAILGTISLDLFVVLLGGAVGLLPIYARDILHTGSWGLGLLRAAPAVGAVAMGAFLARVEMRRRVGLRMFQAVIVFGAATAVFAVSTNLWLSLAALFVLGAADMVSMVIRIGLVQLQTPEPMRGRVGAVNFLFINASNQLGQFESGLAAALIGVVPAALFGGLGSIAVAFLWMWLFPTLRDVERLEAPGPSAS